MRSGWLGAVALLIVGCGGEDSGGAGAGSAVSDGSGASGQADIGAQDASPTDAMDAADPGSAVGDAGGPTGADATGGGTGGDIGPTPQACGCEVGQIKGVVCSPNEQVFVNGATVAVDTVDCQGTPVHAEAKSDAQGLYLLEGVPCGNQTVTVDKGSYHHDYSVVVPPGGVMDFRGVGKKQCFQATSVKLAVITGDWDRIEGILDGLGFSYDLYELYSSGDWYDGDWWGSAAHDLLTDPQKLSQYSALFIDCGGVHWDIVSGTSAGATVRSFVENGGSLYASDWAWIYVEAGWPDAVDFRGPDDASSDGPKKMTGNQTVPGTIVDPALQSYLGSGVMPVKYDLGPLIAVDATAATTEEHVVGFVAQFGVVQPLVMSFRPKPGAGKVIFTNFHNDAQTSQQMATILNYLVFTL